MLNANYEMAYISNFTKIFTVLNQQYELIVKNGACENYEIDINTINGEKIPEYLCICFQKQNGSLVLIADRTIDEEIIDKVVNDIELALNNEIFAQYNFTDLKDFNIFHFDYVKNNIVVDNYELLKNLRDTGQIESLSFHNQNSIIK